MMDIGQNIKTIREIKNLTQEYMAEQLHMSVSNYNYIENGKTNITIDRLQKIAKVLDVDYTQILSLTPTQIFNNNGTASTGIISHQQNYVSDEVIKLLHMKEEQIQKLTLLVEKLLNKEE